jgi:hypothetical protein
MQLIYQELFTDIYFDTKFEKDYIISVSVDIKNEPYLLDVTPCQDDIHNINLKSYKIFKDVNQLLEGCEKIDNETEWMLFMQSGFLANAKLKNKLKLICKPESKLNGYRVSVANGIILHISHSLYEIKKFQVTLPEDIRMISEIFCINKPMDHDCGSISLG